MPEIKITKEETETIVNKLQSYFVQELDQELGQFEAEFLLDFFSKEVGVYFYNKGLQDARAVLASKIDFIDEEIYSLEKTL